jgi:adenine-specific DNA-methyltransferase
MARIDDLIAEIADERVRRAVSAEVKKLREEKKFGLVFENHIPELSYLHGAKIKVGANVVKRGTKGAEVYRVVTIDNGSATIVRDVVGVSETELVAVQELIVVKRFGEAIYPALLPVESVTKNPSKPYHTIINSDNYHALQLLLYCYEGKADVIYIDPPYNTGARDWKYNNAYVDSADQWQHSKWLAMMRKRLLLAKRLLNENGVLIVTIDENEVLHLGMLLSELFPNTEQQLATIVSNPGGSFGSNLSNVNEFAFFVVPKGKDLVRGRPIKSAPSLFKEQEASAPLGRLRKRGEGSLRKDRKNMFYAVYVDERTVEPKFVGEVIPFGEKPTFEVVNGCIPVYPIDEKSIERRWNYGRETMSDEISKGNIVAKKNKQGIIKLYKKEAVKTLKRMNTVWTASEYAAGDYGSRLVNSIFGRPNVFPFPKSIYAVVDSIGSIVSERKDALILDFFAGSGTTLHATCLLNAEDGGERKCVLVTNNEVSAELTKQLHAEGYQQGDAEFEKHGIAEAVTFPRCKYVINGRRDDGTILPGTYLNGRDLAKGFDENLAYFKLDFLDPNEVALGSKFENVLPILWLMAGAQGKLIIRNGKKPFYIPDASPFAVLLKERHFSEFRAVVAERPDITHIFLVTDSPEAFREMSADIGGDRETFMLYKNYLDNFRLNTERTDA